VTPVDRPTGHFATSVLLVAVTVVSLGAWIPFLGRDALAALFHDDAFYYFQVARNAASGNGLTFDGIHATNGFHFLWLVILVPVFAFVSGDLAPLRVIALLETALCAGAAVVLYRTLCRWVDRRNARLVALLLIAMPMARVILRSGLESSLMLFLLLCVWRSWSGLRQDEDGTAGHWLWLGGLCLLAMLARLEAALLLPVIVLFEWQRLRQTPRCLVALALLPTLGLVGYLAWNQLVFDSVLPISGAVKAEWAGNAPFGQRLRALAEFPWVGSAAVLRVTGATRIAALGAGGIALYGGLLAAAVSIVWLRRRDATPRLTQPGVVWLLVAGAVIIVADMGVVIWMPAWYQGPILLATSLVAGLLVSPRMTRWLIPLVIALALVRVPTTALNLKEPGRFYPAQRIAAARWLATNTPEGSRIGSWNAGMLGYFSHRHVVNLDGLVNDKRYLEQVIRGNDLETYLAETSIDFLADQTCGDRPTLLPYISRTGSQHLEERLTLEEAFGHGPARCPGYSVWRLQPR